MDSINRLNSLQQNFYNNLFTNNKNLDFISSDCKSGRFSVYQNTIFNGLASALKITYPGVWTILGEVCANAMANRFVQNSNSLPNTGCLDDWGGGFARFLGKQKELINIKYIEDYAKFEWLYFLAGMANDKTGIAQDDLLEYSEQELNNLIIEFKPSLYLLKSDYNLAELYNFINKKNNKHINFNDDQDNLILSNKKNYILFIKNNSNTQVFWLKPELWQFLSYTYNNKKLGRAVKLTVQLAKSFDLIEALSFMLSNNLIAATKSD